MSPFPVASVPNVPARFASSSTLSKDDDVRKYVIRREIPAKKEGKKPTFKAPKIQRLVTPVVLQRKRHRIAVKRARIESSKQAALEYAELVQQRLKERKEKKHEAVVKKRDARRQSVSA